MKRIIVILAAGGALIFVAAVGLLAFLAGVEHRQDQQTARVIRPWQRVVRLHGDPIVRARVVKIREAQKPILHIYRPLAKPEPMPATPEATVVYHIPTQEPVIFITIDDGVVPNEAALAVMKKHGAVASLFLNDTAINTHYDYFKRWQTAGSTIQNHTVSHPHLPTLPLAQQQQQICDNAHYFTGVFGVPPTLLRPPYGEYNEATRQAAAACGYRTIVHWTATANGGLHYQSPNDGLKPGDIVLLHFTATLDQELTTLFTAAKDRHLQIGRLEDWLR